MLALIKRLNPNARTLMYTCFYALACNGALSLMMGSTMPDLKSVYGLSDTISGVFLSAHSAGNLVAGFISGLVPLYLGRRRSIVLLSSLAFIGFLMMAIWGNPAWLLTAFLFTGMGRGSVTNFTNRTVNELSGGSPTASNLLHASFAIGAIAAPMMFLLGRMLLGWRGGLIIVMACGCISLWNLSRMRLKDDQPNRADQTQRTLTFLKNPSFLILAMMMFCYLCSEYAMNGWLVTYLQNKEALAAALGEKAIEAYSQTMATVLWVVMLAGRLTCAALSMRFSQKKMMLVSSIGVTVFFALMLISSHIALATISVIGLGFCMAGICPMIYSDASVFTNTYPMATGALLAIGSIGAIAMPTVVGALAERFGFTGGMSAIFVTIVLLVIFALLNVFVKTRMPQVRGDD